MKAILIARTLYGSILLCRLMAQILPYIQIILSLLLIALVLLQRSDAGLGSAFGGDGASLGHSTRRGFEKTLFHTTILVGILFAVSAFLSLLLGR